MLIHQGWFTALSRFTKFRVWNLHITNTQYAADTVHQRIFRREAIPSHYFHLREDSSRVYIGKATPVWQLSLSHRCHQMWRTAEPSHSKLRRWKSMLIHQWWFTALDSQSFELEMCILQAPNMPLIRCTNVFLEGRLSRHTCDKLIKSEPEHSQFVSFTNSYGGLTNLKNVKPQNAAS